MKKILTFFAAAMMLCASINAQNSGPCGTNATWEYDSGTLTISGTGEITTYSTTAPTAYPWYSYNGDIQKIIIGEGITNIPDWAFAMYENLVTISLPSTLKSIGNSALEETALWNVSLPEGLETIGHYAFMMCPFTALSLPSTITSFGQAAFSYCDDLETVGCYAAEPPAWFDNTVFDNCSNIATVYVRADKVADYKSDEGWSTFGDKIQSPAGNCGPDGSDDDGDNDETQATWSFDMATHTLTIEGTKMGQYNRPWESAGMGGIGGGFNPDNAVGYPMGIYHVIIGEGIKVIPGSSFYMEVGIQSITLPSTLDSIGLDAFGECFNIETITCNAVTPPAMPKNDEQYVIYGEVNWGVDPPVPYPAPITKIIVPTASVATYKTAPGWSAYASLISDGTASPVEELTQPSNIQITKILRNGQVLIIRDGKTYNMIGTEMK